MARALESVDDVRSTNGLPFVVLSIGHGVPKDVLKENLEGTTCFRINASIDALHTTSTGNTNQRRLGDALNAVAKDLAVTLDTFAAKTLATFSASGCFVMGLGLEGVSHSAGGRGSEAEMVVRKRA